MQRFQNLFCEIKDIKEKKRIFALWQESFTKGERSGDTLDSKDMVALC